MKTLKNEKVAILLAVLPGAVSFLGIGHLYVGRLRRGLVLLVGTWALVSISFFCFVVWSMSGMAIPPPSYPKVEVPTYSLALFAAGFVLSVGFLLCGYGKFLMLRAYAVITISKRLIT